MLSFPLTVHNYEEDPMRKVMFAVLMALVVAVGCALACAEQPVQLVNKGMSPSQVFAPELIPEGWEIVEDTYPSWFQVSDLEYVSFVKKTDEYPVVDGKEMRRRAIDCKAILGLADGMVLWENQKDIRTDLEGQAVIVLAGTVARGPSGRLHVAYLGYYFGKWYVVWSALDDYYGEALTGTYLLPRHI